MSENQSQTDSATPQEAQPLPAAVPGRRRRVIVLAVQVIWIAIKALIVFMLLYGGANPPVIYQRF